MIASSPAGRAALCKPAGRAGVAYVDDAIAEKLGRKVTGLAPIRNSLIAKGMVFSASHGDT